jgi:hypothetical protein
MAKLSDIYNYVSNDWQEQPIDRPTYSVGGEAGSNTDWKPSDAGIYKDWTLNENKEYEFNPSNEAMRELRDQGVLQYDRRSQYQNGENSVPGTFNIQYDKLPKTAFGSVQNTAPIYSNTRLRNDKLQYEDPNYGHITHSKNVKIPTSFMDYIPAAIMAAAGAGFGALTMPAWGNAFGSFAKPAQIIGQSALQGRLPSPWSLAGAALPSLGINMPRIPGLGQLGNFGPVGNRALQMGSRLALNNMSRRIRGGR